MIASGTEAETETEIETEIETWVIFHGLMFRGFRGLLFRPQEAEERGGAPRVGERGPTRCAAEGDSYSVFSNT